jgi:predicted small lipoprotein YifL
VTSRGRAVRGPATALCALALLAGCGSSGPPPLPAACRQPADEIARALTRAPAPVRLSDGTPLSRCVSRARAESDLPAVGVSLTEVADGLRARAGSDLAAALRLGYLVGAVRRGAADTPGVAAQLARRLELAAPRDFATDAARRALARGIRLGEAGG